MTVAQAIQRFRTSYPDCDSALAKQLFDEAYLEIVRQTRARELTYPLSIVAGQAEYDLPSSNVSIVAVDYVPGPEASYPLAASSIDALDRMSTGWRSSFHSGTPDLYAIRNVADGNSSKLVIRFEPAPSLSTTGLYPHIAIHGIAVSTLTDTDTITPVLPNAKAIVSHMCRSFAELFAAQDIDKWSAIYYRDLEEAKTFVRDRAMRAPNVSHSRIKGLTGVS